MSLLPIVALAGLAFLFAAFALRLPRAGWTLFGAALVFGLAGYALQGVPGQPAAPKAAAVETNQTGALLVDARRELFDATLAPSRHVLSSDAFARRGDFENAAGFLTNALREDPRDAEAWVALGNALVEHAEGNPTPAALYAYARAERLEPDNPAAGYFLGLALLRTGDAPRARAIWAAILERAPAEAPWRDGLAMRLQRLDEMLDMAPLQR